MANGLGMALIPYRGIGDYNSGANRTNGGRPDPESPPRFTWNIRMPLSASAWLTMIRPALCTILMAVGFQSTSLAADAWPEFRGPRGDGVVPSLAPSIPTKWTPEENITWRTELPGEGWSSPVIGGGKIYLSAAMPSDDGSDDRVLCLLILDQATGSLEKTVKLMKQESSTTPKIHNKNSHASPTPLLSENRIYIHFGYQGTACTDRQGNVQWVNRDLSFKPTHGNGGSPVLADGKLIFTCDGGDSPSVAALNTKDGSLAWRTPRPVDSARKFSFATPTVIDVDNQIQIIAPGSDCVLALDPASGKIIWQVAYDGFSVIPKPVYADGRLFVISGFMRSTLMAIQPTGKGDITDTHVDWVAKKAIPKTPSPIATDGLVFVVSDDGIVSCFEQTTGELVWKERLGGGFSSSPTLIGDHLYVTSEEGKTTVMKAGRKFELLAENDLEERSLASLAVADGAIYLRTAKALYRIENR
ncbi:outer membrane protein assembly factor BamB family protein [Roseimaritima multifibrata]|nr:PQQ-binding-like beta-propeller repeat protein [Roseimaritima multifibrata]